MELGVTDVVVGTTVGEDIDEGVEVDVAIYRGEVEVDAEVDEGKEVEEDAE